MMYGQISNQWSTMLRKAFLVYCGSVLNAPQLFLTYFTSQILRYYPSAQMIHLITPQDLTLSRPKAAIKQGTE
jgi:cytochrome P450